MSEVQEIKDKLSEISAREKRVFKELEEIKNVQLQMVKVLNDQGWMKKQQEKQEGWLVELTKRIGSAEVQIKTIAEKANNARGDFYEWYIRLSISTCAAIATGIIVWVVTK